MRILALCLFLFAAYTNAFYAMGNIGDNRLQSGNDVYRPAGIVNYTLGLGVFDEPKNLVDYKMAFGFSRLGYSYDEGAESVSLYVLDFNLISWSITFRKVYFEAYVGFSYLLTGSNLTAPMKDDVYEDGFFDAERLYPKYGYRLGYYVMDNLMVAVTANYNYVWWIFDGFEPYDHKTWLIGGFGLSVQYNIF